MPGLSLELLMPSVSVVAGTMVASAIVARNNTGQEVTVESGVAVVADASGTPATPDPRAFLAIPKTGPPGAYETRVPPGQTRDIMDTAQLPFAATTAIHLRAGASLGVLPAKAMFSQRVTSVQVEIPLQMTAATSVDELKLELKADSQQWCVRATDSRGARPTGALFLALTARGARVTDMTGDVPSATGDAWAMRWTQFGSPSLLDSGPATLTVWVGGPHYVTARAAVTVNGHPQP